MCELWPVLPVLLCCNISFYVLLWYPVYCNELTIFWELSAHFIEKLALHRCGLFLSVSGAPLLKKCDRELSTVDESLWLHVKHCVSWDTLIRNAWTVPETHPIVWTSIGACCSVPGHTCNRVANFKPNPTFPVYVRAVWVILGKSSKIQKIGEKVYSLQLEVVFGFRRSFFSICVTEQTCSAIFHQVGLIELSFTVLKDTFWPKSWKTFRKTKT